ncbi:MAG: Crp/Fnr family transcriptional regulator [Bacteroidota bacterium]
MNPPALIQSTYHSIPALSKLGDFLLVHQAERIPKNEVLVRRNGGCPSYWIIETGLLRSFIIDAEGNEVTTGFYGTGDISLEFSSFFLDLPAKESLKAETDTKAYAVPKSVFFQYFNEVPALQEWGRGWMVNFLIQRQNRYLESHTLSAPERYEALISARPSVIRYAALKHIASYLNIADSTLSRIRKNINPSIS